MSVNNNENVKVGKYSQIKMQQLNRFMFTSSRISICLSNSVPENRIKIQFH